MKHQPSLAFEDLAAASSALFTPLSFPLMDILDLLVNDLARGTGHGANVDGFVDNYSGFSVSEFVSQNLG